MSNFLCDKCGTEILEGDDGRYITGCRHYQLGGRHNPGNGWQRKLLGTSHYFDAASTESLCGKATRNEHLPITEEPTTTKCLVCLCKLMALPPQKELFEEKEYGTESE